MVCNDLPTLVWLANLAWFDFHPWFSRTDWPDHPDFVVFDLDPTLPTGFPQALQVARLVKAVMDPFGLRANVKTSGATCLHLHLPIQRRYSYKLFCLQYAPNGGCSGLLPPGLVGIDRFCESGFSELPVDPCQVETGGRFVCRIAGESPKP